MAIIAPTPIAAQATCPPWCRLHDHEFGACLAADILLDFGPATPGDGCHRAAIGLRRTTDGTESIGLAVNGGQYVEFHPDAAAALAYGILAQLATARTTTGPTGGETR